MSLVVRAPDVTLELFHLLLAEDLPIFAIIADVGPGCAQMLQLTCTEVSQSATVRARKTCA